ncbi:MAG: Rid family detoxifying hydrolase [Wenyingzhuangia sp.]|jgi:2-iminobutanoate/2-iminopropanoate deaminase|uniref:Rid family detoxifying hydrolase n=1 Tax=Wenyingzhuangia sp. TaxID=1964193 RepID=UPI00321AC856
MKKIIHTTKAPAPLGPYNQGIAIDGVLYVSGQIAIHPETGRLENKDIQTETVRVMKNIEAILREAGTTFENVVKTSILLTNMDDFVMVNKAYGTYFDEDTAPARECAAVSKLPKHASVEISAIAHL